MKQMQMFDMLGEIFDKQQALQLRLGTDFSKLSDEERVAFIKEHSIHATQELHELLYELPFFKPWKDYSEMGHMDRDIAFRKARKEYSDFMHFVVNIGLGLGLTADMVHEDYMDKNKENHRRQDDGYTHDKFYR